MAPMPNSETFRITVKPHKSDYSAVVDTYLDALSQAGATFQETDHDAQLLLVAIMDQMGLNTELARFVKRVGWDEDRLL